MENKLIMSQKEECTNYNLITENINKLVNMCGNTKEAIEIRDYLFDLFTRKYSEPLFTVLGLQEDLGCPLDMVLNLVKETNKLDEHCRTQDIWFDYKGKLISGSFATLKYHNNEFIIEVETYEMFDSNYDCDSYELLVKDYKKTWWLKEDRSM